MPQGLDRAPGFYIMGILNRIQDAYWDVPLCASLWEDLPLTTRVGTQGVMGMQKVKLRLPCRKRDQVTAIE